MALLDLLMNAGGGNAVTQLAEKFGLSADQVQSAMTAMVPSVQGGLQQQAQAGGGLGAILDLLKGQDHSSYANDPTHPEAEAAGSGILGKIMGGEGIQSVVQEAAAKTGISADVLQKMLPNITAMAAGHVTEAASTQPESGSGGLMGMVSGMLGRGQGGNLGGVAKMLDMDGDGNPLNDIMGMAGKLFGKKS